MLQRIVFRRTPDLLFIERHGEGRHPEICKELKHFVRAGLVDKLTRKRALADLLCAEAAGRDRPVLISDENISVDSSLFWEGRDAPPEKVIHRLFEVTAPLRKSGERVQLLLGIRDAPNWLGSRYAQSMRSKPHLGQDDFDTRMEMVAGGETVAPQFGWLDHKRVRSLAEERFGADNVMLFASEGLTDHPEEAFEALSRFIGADLYPAFVSGGQNGMKLRNNSLSAEPGRWRIPTTDEELVLEPGLAARLWERFEAGTLAPRRPPA